MPKYKVGTELKMNSKNGICYKVLIVNHNPFREPSMEYAVDMYDQDGNHYGYDVQFVGEDFLNKFCEIVREP